MIIRKKFHRILIIAVLIIAFSSNGVFALSYVIENGSRVPIPTAYMVDTVIGDYGDFGSLSNPSDLFLDDNNDLYVADTGNNRILKLDDQGTVSKEYTNPGGGQLSVPEGIFVDRYGDLYIADTGNMRIVHLSADGGFIEQFVKPQSKLISSDFKFTPSKLAVGKTGLIYILNKTQYQGFFTIDSLNNFMGYTGATKVGYSFFDVLLRRFGSSFQKQMTQKRLPQPASNFFLEENIIYATITGNLNKPCTIVKYSSVGTNLFPAKQYGDSRDDYNKLSLSQLVDIAVDPNGIISVLDQKNGKVFQYDQNGNMLDAFGALGNKKGQFMLPVSIVAYPDGKIAVLDSMKGNIQIFKTTKFIDSVHAAVKSHYNGQYSQARRYWEEVLEVDQSYTLAQRFIAEAKYKNNDLQGAMKDFEYIGDKEGFSKAFSEYRHDIYRKYFVVVLAVILLIIIFLIYGIQKTRNATANNIMRLYNAKPDTKMYLWLIPGIVFKPYDAFSIIKRKRNDLSYFPAIVILTGLTLSYIISINMMHFPLATIDVRTNNIMTDLAIVLLPLISWIISIYFVSSIMDGEVKFKELTIACSYSVIPYIILILPLTAFSYTLEMNQLVFFEALNGIMIAWVIALLLSNLFILNNYNFGKLIKVSLLGVIGVVIIWFLSFMLYSMSIQVYQFIATVLFEFSMLFS